MHAMFLAGLFTVPKGRKYRHTSTGIHINRQKKSLTARDGDKGQGVEALGLVPTGDCEKIPRCMWGRLL